MHIDIDETNVGFVTRHFSQICSIVMATVKNQQNKFKYAPRIEPNNYKYVSYFRPVAI